MTHQVQSIPFAHTNNFSTLFLDYVNQEDNLKSLYQHPPTLSSFQKQIELKKNFSQKHRQVLHQTLKKQYQNIADAPTSQIDLLLDENTFTITTGHQLSLFTGPLYFIYKILTTIRTTEELKKEYPIYNFVPIFWMHTEDHDFEEINHFHLFGKTYQWESEQTGAVGRFQTEGLKELFETLPEQLALFEKAYLEQQNLAEATRFLAHKLFKKYGLVCLNPDDQNLKNLFRPVLEKEVLTQSSRDEVENQTKKLNNLGYKTLVTPREINLFYMKGALRSRIIPDGLNFKVLNTDLQFTEGEMRQEIQESPQNFSPNVVLRPLYQEVILPNLSYVGGPGEIAYWLQLKTVFDLHQTPFPILQPRNFALILNKANTKKFKKLDLEISQLFDAEDKLRIDFTEKNSNVEIQLAEETQEIKNTFQKLSGKALQIDASLKGWLGSEEQKVLKAFQNIEKRLRKAQEKNLETEIKQLLTLKQKLFPEGSLQERHDNFLNFYLNQSDFIDILHKNFQPLTLNMSIFLEDN